MNGRPVRIAVCCAGTPNPEMDSLAEEVGTRLARAQVVLLCGGLRGGMEAVARGAQQAGGQTIGLLPGANPGDANDYITLPLATGLGEARNVVLVRSAQAVIAIGGEWGTLSEIALARKLDRPVVLLAPTLAANLPLPTAHTAEEAVNMALALVKQ